MPKLTQVNQHIASKSLQRLKSLHTKIDRAMAPVKNATVISSIPEQAVVSAPCYGSLESQVASGVSKALGQVSTSLGSIGWSASYYIDSTILKYCKKDKEFADAEIKRIRKEFLEWLESFLEKLIYRLQKALSTFGDEFIDLRQRHRFTIPRDLHLPARDIDEDDLTIKNDYRHSIIFFLLMNLYHEKTVYQYAVRET